MSDLGGSASQREMNSSADLSTSAAWPHSERHTTAATQWAAGEQGHPS